MDSFGFNNNSTLPGFENSLTGTVKWFNIKSGFGFITPEDGTDDIFVHRSSIVDEGIRDLNDGEKVTYKIVVEDGKNKAANVHVEAGADGNPPQKPRKWPEGVSASEGKQIGQVKWFDVTKGFGFLTPLSGGEDVFVHKSSVSGSAKSGKTLMEGEEVEFAIENDDNDKPKAVGVCGPNGEAVQGVPQRRYGGNRGRGGPRRNNNED